MMMSFCIIISHVLLIGRVCGLFLEKWHFRAIGVCFQESRLSDKWAFGPLALLAAVAGSTEGLTQEQFLQT